MSRRAELWEIRLAIEAAADHVLDLGVSIDGADWLDRAADRACGMHGILDARDQRAVRRGVELRFGAGSVAA